MLDRYAERSLRKHSLAASSSLVYSTMTGVQKRIRLPGSFPNVSEDLASPEVPDEPKDQRQDKENRNVNRATRHHASSRADVRPCELFLPRSLDRVCPPPRVRQRAFFQTCFQRRIPKSRVNSIPRILEFFARESQPLPFSRNLFFLEFYRLNP